MSIIKPNPNLLNWEVESQRLFNKDGKSLKDYRILVRNDSGNLLNVCKTSYHPTMNEKFKEVVQKMQEITGFSFEGYVEAKGGKRIFAYLKSDNAKIAGFDFKNYMVIGNSHDYSSGFFVSTVHEMLRCSNQWAKVNKGVLHTIQHTKQSTVKIDELVIRFESYMKGLEKTSRELEVWKEIEISDTVREMLIQRILNLDLEEKLSTRTEKRVEILENSIMMESNDIGNNLLGLFQGITHYTTHVLQQKEKVFGNIIGSGYDLNAKAFDFCQTMAEGAIDSIDFSKN